MVGPKFLEIRFRILSFIALNGPSTKKMIDQRLKPKVDKPRISKAVDSLRAEELIRIRRTEKSGMVKYYEITAKALDAAIVRDWTKVDRIQKILEKNPSLRPHEEWVRTVQDLRHIIASTHDPNGYFWTSNVAYYFPRPPREVLWQLVYWSLRLYEAPEARSKLQAIFKILRQHPEYEKMTSQIMKEELVRLETLVQKGLQVVTAAKAVLETSVG